MKLPKILDLVKQNARFERYRDGVLWYTIEWVSQESIGNCPVIRTFDFPVPVIDTDDTNGRFNATESGITMMRWIRKHLEYMNSALAESEENEDENQ